MSADPYVYPGTDVLRNKFDLRDAAKLEAAETQWVIQRIARGVPQGGFDLAHLRAIHKHLFGRIYVWAGEVRCVELAKGGSSFLPCKYIDTGIADIHTRLENSGFLKGLSAQQFAKEAAGIVGDVNYAHPFRDGNGRTQLLYLKQLAYQAGHPVDLEKLERSRWLRASIAAVQHDYRPMAEEIARIAEPRARAPEKERGLDI